MLESLSEMTKRDGQEYLFLKCSERVQGPKSMTDVLEVRTPQAPTNQIFVLDEESNPPLTTFESLYRLHHRLQKCSIRGQCHC